MIEKDCLAYQPFAGDRVNTKELRNAFVTTRKAHQCNICWDEIPGGTRVRALTERLLEDDRPVMTFYFCLPCCEAMAIVDQDEGKAIEERSGIGLRRSGQLPAEETTT